MYSEAGPGSPGTGLEWVVHGAGRTLVQEYPWVGPWQYHPCIPTRYYPPPRVHLPTGIPYSCQRVVPGDGLLNA